MGLSAGGQPLEGERLSIAALVAANLVPLVGVVLLGWQVLDLMVLYWAETAIIGLSASVKGAIMTKGKSLLLAPFFVIHAGIFMGGHLIVILAFFTDPALRASDIPAQSVLRDTASNVALPLGALAASHATSFVTNFVRRGERPPAGTGGLLLSFYGRVIVMHVVILLGGGLAMALGTPAYALAMLVAVKTAVDVRAHRKERRRHAPGQAAPPSPATPQAQ